MNRTVYAVPCTNGNVMFVNDGLVGYRIVWRWVAPLFALFLRAQGWTVIVVGE